MENSENDRDGDTENENTKKSEEEPLISSNPNEQTDRMPSPTPSPANRDKTKWIFEIFHGEEHVYGIRQININGSETFIGTPGGKAVHIELMDGKEIQTVTFSGLN